MNVLGHIDEGRDALMRAGLAPASEARAAWDAWARSGANPDVDGIAQRWLPLIAWNLGDADLDASTLARFRAARQGAWAWNARVLDAARPALSALVAAGIPVVVLKGAALAATVYDPPGVRIIGDVDVLVPPADAARACALLARDGWVPQQPIGGDLLSFRHALDLIKPPHGALDLHWHLLHECCWDDADAGLWRRRRSRSIAGVPAAVLDPADQLLHVCIHGLRWSPVHAGQWVADAAWIIRASADLDWSLVVKEARRRRLGVQLCEALTCVRDRSTARVPDEALAALRELPSSARDRLECYLKGRSVVSAGGMFVIWCGWRRATRLGGRRVPWLGFLSAAVRLESTRQLIPWFARHAIARARAVIQRRPRRGASTRERLTSTAA